MNMIYIDLAVYGLKQRLHGMMKRLHVWALLHGIK